MDTKVKSKFAIFTYYWLPVIIWMLVIFYFSSQSYEQQDLRPWLRKTVQEETVKEHLSDVKVYYNGNEVSIQTKGVPGFIEFFIRKGAHLTEYAILGFLSLRALRVTINLRFWLTAVIALFISFIYACSDELHQMYTYKRTPMFVDVVVDSIGACIGIIIFLGFWYFYVARKR